MLLTPNYSLKKPDGTDNFDIANENGNMDAIDTALHNHDLKFDPTTGHKHTGATGDAPQIGTSGIADGAITAAKVATDVATQAELDAVSTVANAAIPTTQKGSANGVASLDSGGQVPASQLGNVPPVNASTSAARGTVRVSANPAAGDPISPSRIGVASDVNLASTAETSIASYNPAAAGNFLILVYLRVVTGTTTVTVKVTYADVTGAQTTFIINAQVTAIGSYSLLPLFINAVAGTLIDVRVTASVANQVKASASILGV